MGEPAKRRPSTADRRASRRRAPRASIRVECRKGNLGLGRNISKQFLDLSETGIRLVALAELRSGDETEVVLIGAGSGRPVKRLGRVVWSVKTGEDGYCIGIHFEKPLRYQELLELSTGPSLMR